MSHPELLLTNQLCFLVYRLEKGILARYRPLLDAIGLTYPQYLAMLVLWEQDGRSVGDFCNALSLDTGTVSPLLQRLEVAGLVERRREGKDERSVTIRLTDSGKALEEQARTIPGTLASCLELDATEYVTLQGTLRSLIDRL